jgi:hypothetical protein
MITTYDNTMSSLMCRRFRSTIEMELAHWKRDGIHDLCGDVKRRNCKEEKIKRLVAS